MPPRPFLQALAAAAARTPLPSPATSDEMREQFGPVILERAWASARVHDAALLDDIGRTLTRLISPAAASARGQRPINRADARLAIKRTLASIGWTPEANGVRPGSLQDLTSDRRLNLIIDTHAAMLRGQAHHTMALSDGALAARPAQELYRRIEPKGGPAARRDWPSRWRAAGGAFYDGGRMIALVTDPIWERISRFGLPHPPFDFGSGMHVRPISYSECQRIGFPVPPLAEMLRSKPLRQIASRVETALPSNPALAKAVQEAFRDRAFTVQTPKGERLAIYPKFDAIAQNMITADNTAIIPLRPVPDDLRRLIKDPLKPTADIQVSASELRHILLRHGPGSPDRNPVLPGDINLIQTILSTPDLVRDAGGEGLFVEKAFGDRRFRVVLIRRGSGKLIVQTMYRV